MHRHELMLRKIFLILTIFVFFLHFNSLSFFLHISFSLFSLSHVSALSSRKSFSIFLDVKKKLLMWIYVHNAWRRIEIFIPIFLINVHFNFMLAFAPKIYMSGYVYMNIYVQDLQYKLLHMNILGCPLFYFSFSFERATGSK